MKEGNHACDPPVQFLASPCTVSTAHLSATTSKHGPIKSQRRHRNGFRCCVPYRSKSAPAKKKEKKSQQPTTINHPHVCARVRNAMFLLRAAYVSRYSLFYAPRGHHSADPSCQKARNSPSVLPNTSTVMSRPGAVGLNLCGP